MTMNSDYNYIHSKMEHMKRVGLIAKTTTRGKHGGACPDWLRRLQDEEKKSREKQLSRRFIHSYSAMVAIAEQEINLKDVAVRDIDSLIEDMGHEE